MSGSVQVIGHRNRNSIPARTHALAFRSGFENGGERCEVRVNRKRRMLAQQRYEREGGGGEGRGQREGKLPPRNNYYLNRRYSSFNSRAFRDTSRVPVSSLRDEITNTRHDANARVPISELIITCTSARRERITS